MIFTAKIQIELFEDAVEYKRAIGMRDTAIIHEICAEIMSISPFHLTERGLEFTECEIKVEPDNKIELPF